MQLSNATTILASCFLAIILCAESVKAATSLRGGGNDNNLILENKPSASPTEASPMPSFQTQSSSDPSSQLSSSPSEHSSLLSPSSSQPSSEPSSLLSSKLSSEPSSLLSSQPSSQPTVIEEDEEVEILAEDTEGTFLISVVEYGEEADIIDHEEISNIVIDDNIYEIDSADTSQEEGKKIKSGATVVVPAGTMLGKSGKASTNGALIKEEGDRKKKGGDKDKRKSLFERYLKTTTTNEQQHNIEQPQLHRQLYSTFTGEKSVVAVRVVVSDGAYSNNEDYLRNKVFGTNGDAFNLKSAYAQCSDEKLIFNPRKSMSANGASIDNGVLTIELSDMRVRDGESAIRNAVTARIKALFGIGSLRDVASYWMYCIPSGAWSGSIAYAYIDHYLSVYNDEWCNYASGQVHEIGHNLNFGHSGEGSNKYDDRTGMMGYSYSSDEGPAMCFNAAKSWQSGWYADKSIVMAASCQTVVLSGIADYPNTSNEVLVKINLGGNDLFISFNAKKGINSGTQEAANRVTVVQAGKGGEDYSTSTLLAKLSNGQTYNHSSGASIQVTDVVSSDYAEVFISLGDCNAPRPPPTTPPPQSPPTYWPTYSPTGDPDTNPNQLEVTFSGSGAPPNPLPKCRGDCDNDSHCEGSLVCFQRSGTEAVPGCTGTGASGTDYCAERPTQNTVWLKGDNGRPAANFPLGHCEGDCDSDADCQPGLICQQRSGTEAIPGCVGNPIPGEDYCRYSDNPPVTPPPTPKPTQVVTSPPTPKPTSPPTKAPSARPTKRPTPVPSNAPTPRPSNNPISPPTPPTSSSSSYLLACGSSSASCSGQTAAADKAEDHEVRCCRDSDASGWNKFRDRGAICTDVWGRSRDSNGVCQHALNYEEASAMCANMGGRLCSSVELLEDCTRDTGCGHNSDLIWSSTEASSSPDSPSSTPAPTSLPTPLPTKVPTPPPNVCSFPAKPIWLTIGTNGQQPCSERRNVGINDQLTMLFYSQDVTVENSLDDLKKIEVEYKVMGDKDRKTKWRVESDFFDVANQSPYATTAPDGVLRFRQTIDLDLLEGNVQPGEWLEWKWKVETNAGLKVELRSSDADSGGVIYVQ